MTKRKEMMMELPDGSDQVTSSLDVSEEDLGTVSDFSLASSGLKPKLDSIFSEVEKNLPEIDFDLSDVGSDNEEPVIFHQHLKSMSLDEEKDLDTSQEHEKLSDISAYNNSYNSSLSKEDNILTENIVSDNSLSYPGPANDTTDKNLVESKGVGTSDVHIYDNDLAYELQQWGVNLDPQNTGSPDATSWADIPKESIENTNQTDNDYSVTSWSSIPIPPDQTVKGNKETEDDKVKEQPKEEMVEFGNRPLNETEKNDKQMKKQLEREKTRIQEREMVTNFVSPRGPMLSMQAIDNIDLDNLLQSINEDNQFSPPVSRQAWTIMDMTQSNSLNGGGEGIRRRNTENENMTLIQKLAKMTMEQSGEDLSDIDPRTGARKKRTEPDNRLLPDDDEIDEQSEMIQPPLRLPENESKAAKSEAAAVAGYLDGEMTTPNEEAKPKKQTASCGTNTNDFVPRILTPRVPPRHPPPKPSSPEMTKKDKEPTVFIDLRNFDQLRQEQQQSIEKVQKVLGIDPNERRYADSSSDSEDDLDSWRQQRQKFKQSVVTRGVSAKPLPNKPRLASHKKPQRVINMADRQVSQRRPDTEEQQERNVVIDREAQQRALAEEREKQRREEIVRKLREQRENEHQTKLRLQKRLEALRPSASISGRQDQAETTPVVFDLESSYEPSPRSLPVIMSQEQECLLLSIHLSSNGELVLHRGSSNKSVDTGTGLSASYTTLLTWLLSLVPENFAYLQENSNSPVTSPWMLPFYVVGCQQMLMDEKLYLMVAVTPVERFDAKSVPVKSKPKKSKSKDDLKGTSAFHQHLTKYLSTNTLHSVCPWLQDMVSTDVRPPSSNNKDISYAYRPPLPNITTKPLSTFIEVSPDHHAASKVFNTSVGFFWQTVDSDESRLDQDINDKDVTYDVQNTMSLVYKKIFQDPRSMMGLFNRVLQEGLDLAGVRLVYPTPELIGISKANNSEAQSEMELLNKIGPVLAICLRGTLARSIWLDAVGPSDPVLARRTDPNSLCALYGGDSRDECLLFCPRNHTRVQQELARWFGGRVPPGNVIDVGAPYTRKETLRTGSPKGRKSKKVTFSEDKDKHSVHSEPVHRPLATLTATTKSEIFLVLSPLVPPKCFGLVLATCQRRGYYVRGIKRCRLSTKRASSLGISGKSLDAFCPGTSSSAPGSGSFDDVLVEHLDPHKHGKQLEAAHPSTIFQLEKENGSHSAASLVEACMVQMTMQGIMADVQKRESFPVESKHMFHAARYSDGLLTALGGEFSKCFDPEIQINPNYVIPELYTNPELEQITALLLLGHEILKTCGLLIGRILSVVPRGKVTTPIPFTEGLELLGMKWLPCLTASQAKEVTPHEAGDRLWKDSLHSLTNEPCLVLALRGVNALAKLESVIPSQQNKKSGVKGHLDMIHSRSAEQAYSFMRLFFMEKELFSDPLSRPMLPYIPHHLHEAGDQSHAKKSRHLQTYPHEESIFDIMMSGPISITTFLLVKPRAVQRHLPKILKKIVHEGFQIVGLHLRILIPEKIDNLISADLMEADKEKHLSYLRSGPSLCLALQRENAVKKLLDLVGPEDPQSARRNSQFYWRGVFGVDPVCNGLYCSGTYIDAVEDLKMYFPDGLCCKETEVLQNEMISCPGNDSITNIKFSSIREVVCHELSAVNTADATESSHSLLLQTTCIVLTPLLMKKLGSHHGFVELIEGLVSQGFEFVGVRMVWFTQDQAEHFLVTVGAGSFQLVPLLMSGPNIVLALQRDNAVLAFDTILRETFSTDQIQGKSTTDSLLSKYGQMILRPTEISQAHNLLGFFFDHLLPNSQIEIISKEDQSES